MKPAAALAKLTPAPDPARVPATPKPTPLIANNVKNLLRKGKFGNVDNDLDLTVKDLIAMSKQGFVRILKRVERWWLEAEEKRAEAEAQDD